MLSNSASACAVRMRVLSAELRTLFTIANVTDDPDDLVQSCDVRGQFIAIRFQWGAAMSQ